MSSTSTAQTSTGQPAAAPRSKGQTLQESDVVRRLRAGLVVSCQALPGEPLHGPDFMVAMAQSAVLGGAAAVRVNGLADVAAVSAAVDVPVIGLWKDGADGVYITPTLQHALALVDSGADVVALDATARPRRDGVSLEETIAAVHAAGALVMADVSTLPEGVAAASAGADIVATTLSGYTGEIAVPDGPDLDLLRALVDVLDVPVLAEGRIHTPEQAAAAYALGAHAVVVGSAISRPSLITQRFAAALAQVGQP